MTPLPNETPNSDAESIPQPTQQDKGKGRAVGLQSEDEEMPDVDELPTGGTDRGNDGVSLLAWPVCSRLWSYRVLIYLLRTVWRL